MAEFNINNLELDDNNFVLIPDGDYHFEVSSHEVGYSTSEKMPPNTQQIRITLEIPFTKDGETRTGQVKHNLNIYKKAMFAIRQFVECIGMAPEKGRMNVNLEEMDGRTGVCAINSREYNGNEYNNVLKFYPPSKAPAVTANDTEWNQRGGFVEVNNDDEPPFI